LPPPVKKAQPAKPLGSQYCSGEERNAMGGSAAGEIADKAPAIRHWPKALAMLAALLLALLAAALDGAPAGLPATPVELRPEPTDAASEAPDIHEAHSDGGYSHYSP
jgi:hypothetical protein